MEEGRIIKIGIIGAESSGKSWLCENLAAHFGTACVPEYAREYFNSADIKKHTTSDLLKIAGEQLNLEHYMEQKARRFLFCDTALITIKIWAELEFQTVPKELDLLSESFTYDFYLLTDNQVEWVEDPQRLNKFSRDMIFEMNLREVKKSGIPYAVVTGKANERLTNAVEILETRFGV